MRRRRLLAAIGTGSVATAGCLAGGDGADGTDGTPPATDPPPSGTEPGRRYEECSREVLPYDQLPAEIRAEVDAALEGSYTAERVYLREAMDVDGSYLSVEETYYDPSVTEADGGETLELERVEPKALPNPRSVSVEQQRDDERTIRVEVTAADGTVLVDAERTLHPGGDVEFGETRRVGSHEVRVTVERDGVLETEFTDTVRINESVFDVLVVVDPEEVYLTGAVADLGVCIFDP